MIRMDIKAKSAFYQLVLKRMDSVSREEYRVLLD